MFCKHETAPYDTLPSSLIIQVFFTPNETELSLIRANNFGVPYLGFNQLQFMFVLSGDFETRSEI